MQNQEHLLIYEWMQTTLLSPEPWAQMEFGTVQLGDKRNTRRLVQRATALAKMPAGPLPVALPTWKDLKAAYRLLTQPEMTHAAVQSEHCRRVREACRQPGRYLWIEDTTLLDYSTHRHTADLGRVGDDRGLGFYVHTTLAVRIERWSQGRPLITVVGIAHQHCWVRPQTALCSGEPFKRQRFERSRESDRWAKVLLSEAKPPPQVHRLYIADCESDIYEVFERCQASGTDFVIRANQPRALAEADGSVFTTVAQQKVGSWETVDVSTRAHRPAHQAQLEVRWCRVQLRGPWRPGGSKPPLMMTVVEAREINVPAEVEEPIHWVLLTNRPCRTAPQAHRLLQLYSQRWTVEEYHKALKTGTHVEASQLGQQKRLAALLGVLALVAVRLLDSKLLGRGQPQGPVDQLGPEVLELLTSKYGYPPQGWTQETAWIAIARLGGFLARKGDGMPGWLTIWRGWQKLMLLIEGKEYASTERCG